MLPETYERIVTNWSSVWRVDLVEEGIHPRCPRCGIVMRDIPGGWVCPACSYKCYAQFAQQPMDPNLSSIGGG